MTVMKELCLLLVLGIVVTTTANPFIGHFHLFSCLLKRCHRYARCQVQNFTIVCVCPEKCPRNLAPVCGSDWKTYNNYCELRRASCLGNRNTRLRYYGSCKSGSCRHTFWSRLSCPYYSRCELMYGLPRCVCPKEICSASYNPVCGSDGRTYRNICDMRKKACRQRKMLYVRHPGHCRPDPCARIDCCCGARCSVNETNHARCECNLACTLHYDPVCGSDGRTYGNACGLGTTRCTNQDPKLRIVKNGPCPTASPETTSPRPTNSTLCGGTSCDFYAKCQVRNGTEQCVCPSLCPLIVSPVCGSNGITYINICDLRRDSCKKQQLVYVVNEGRCRKTTANPVTLKVFTTNDPCATVKCGYYAVCEDRNGTARCVCQRLCPIFGKPVCGSNGVIYGNLCELRRESCIKKEFIEAVSMEKCNITTANPVRTNAPTTLTPCAAIRCGFFARCEVINGSAGCVCPEICPEIYYPVCGSDGVTYGNTCELEKASCTQQKSIRMVKKGECQGSTLSCPIPRKCFVYCDKEECARKGQICCCRGCGNVCTTPIKKLGRDVCPPVEDSCSLDEDCPRGTKCCLDGCTKKCVTPIASVDTEMKSL